MRALGALALRIRKLAPVERGRGERAGDASICWRTNSSSARAAPASKGNVIEETALEVRTALIDSLAAAKADQWEEAESLRLDAYTSFDSEIEVRVLPRNPELGRRTERSFLDGTACASPASRRCSTAARRSKSSPPATSARCGARRIGGPAEGLGLARDDCLHRIFHRGPRRARGGGRARGAARRPARSGKIKAPAAASPPARGWRSAPARSLSGSRKP